MPDSVTMTVLGLDQIEAQLKNLGGKGAERAVSAGLSAAAQEVVKEARRLAPVDTGNLKKSIYKFKTKRRNRKHPVQYSVGVRVRHRKSRKTGKVTSRGAYYWHLVEFGTSKMAAQPFLRPALRNKRQQLIERIRKKTSERIAAEALKKL